MRTPSSRGDVVAVLEQPQLATEQQHRAARARRALSASTGATCSQVRPLRLPVSQTKAYCAVLQPDPRQQVGR